MRISFLNKYLGLFLIVFAGFSNHVVLPVSPSVIFWILGSLLLLCFKPSKTQVSTITGLWLIFSIYLVMTQSILGAPPGRVIGLIVSISFYPLVVYFAQNISLEVLYKFSGKFVNFSLILLIVEFVLRIVYPIEGEAVEKLEQFSDHESLWIYQYKVSSFMYADSNGTAIHLLIILFFLLFLQRKIRIKFVNIKVILLVSLIFLTFSRAAIISLLVGFAFFFFYYSKGKVLRYFLVFSAILGGIMGSVFIYSYFKDDLSFQSKILILELSYNYFSNVNLPDFLVGIGLSHSIEQMGIYTHNLFLTFMMETGFVGFIFQLLIFLKIIQKSKDSWLILFPFLIATLTSINTYVPYLYVSLALIYSLNMKENWESRQLSKTVWN